MNKTRALANTNALAGFFIQCTIAVPIDKIDQQTNDDRNTKNDPSGCLQSRHQEQTASNRN